MLTRQIPSSCVVAATLLVLVAGCSGQDQPDQAARPGPTAVAEGGDGGRGRPKPKAEREALPNGVPVQAQPAIVEKHVDGDTLWVRVEERGGPLRAKTSHSVRLLEIDSPETRHPSEGVECGGAAASRFAARKLSLGSKVFLVADQEDTDQYGRYLRYVWTEDGEFFNQMAVSAGHAKAVLYEPNDRFINKMRAAQARARKAQRGIWGPPCNIDKPAVTKPKPLVGMPKPVRQSSSCAAGYDPCVPAYPPDVNCPDVDGPITVTGSDPHGLDADGDGVACES